MGKILAAVALALLLAGCLPVTTATPVGTTVGLKPDPALTGLWKARVKGESDYVALFPQQDGSITAVMLTPDGKNAGWGTFSLSTATLGAYRYMNVREISSDGKPADPSENDKTFPALYRINGDGAMVIYLMDEARVKRAIAANKLAGTVEGDTAGGTVSGDISITASASDLDTYLATPAGRALFNKPLMILRKVK